MRLGDLIRHLEVYERDLPVEFDIPGVHPTNLESWRGVYAELALGYVLDHKYGVTTVGELLDDCKEAIGKTFQGYKGGDFTMNEHTTVRVDNPGQVSDVHLIGVSQVYGEVVLHTMRVSP